MDAMVPASASEKCQLHAVVVPYPAQGHINPCMQLAKQLASRGFTITFVNTDHNHARILASHSQHSSIWKDEGLDIRFASIPDELPDHHDRMADLASLSQAVDDQMPAHFEALVAELCSSDDSRPTCIVSDLFMNFTQDVANKFGVPRVAVWCQSAASFAIHVHMPLISFQGYLPVTDVSNYMYNFKLRPFQRLQEAKCVLINTFDDLERDVLKALNDGKCNVLAAGPFLPPASLSKMDSKDNRTGTGIWPEDQECITWLENQKESSVLFISFGSIARLSDIQFKELVLGLEASQKLLLWAIRPSLKELIHSLLPKSFLEGEHVYLTSWVPQTLILSHRSVGGFLTHGGWNSTLESLSFGVPTIVWPCFSDQMLNRKWIVEEWKTGKGFQATNAGFITREDIERLV
ncbi:hypothetical protein KP509_18G023100 [Ceratopteris richardii]|uniref:Glycosyltransferase n=1 Tax=Ceratopteris richardii TaxID=49495 RepID=A0A8T2SSL7_CERRI|nr:hypothetical protein KP509_18G023100 [Ceratopteris richardii]